MAVITLTTEWRDSDFYHGVLRGTLTRLAPEATVIVNASDIPPLNTSHAAFVIRNTFHHYPEGSVHLVCVNTEPGKKGRHLLVKAQGHYFIGTDNGIFNLILNKEPDEVIIIKNDNKTEDIQLFAETAAAVVKGSDINNIGPRSETVREMIPFRATIDEGTVNGSIIFIDSYGNAITNITRDTFERVFSNNPFTILIQSNRHRASSISHNYSDEPVGELLALFNSMDLLEIAINGSSVSELFGLSTGSVIRVISEKPAGTGRRLFK